MRLLGYVVILAAVVVLVWPGSRAGQGVAAMAGGLASTLRGGTQ